MNVVCFGDSLTEGWHNRGKSFSPYTNTLSRLVGKYYNIDKIKYNIVNEGVSGETICKDMKKRLPKCLSKYPNTKVLVIQGGTNDILLIPELQNEIDLFTEFQTLLDIAMDNGVKNILILTTLEGYYEAIDDASMSNEVSNKLRRKFNEKIIENFGENKTMLHNNMNIKVCNIEKELPMFQLTSEEQGQIWDDNIHPTAYGYQKMGELVFYSLKEMLD